jgi:thymidylate kinase
MVERPVLNLVRILCNALEEQSIAYCHWKSNAAIDRSASGDNDLDLLISRADARRFTDILYQLGFKEARGRAHQRLPGVLDYYGYDCAADKLVHVHAHYQLILGDDLSKNYRLPIELPFLDSARQTDLFKLPSPEFEFVVLVIRMILKHATWDSILSFRGTLPATARHELEYLRAGVNQAQVLAILQQHLPFIDTALFDRCVQSLQPGCTIWTRAEVAWQLQSKLQAHARRSRVADTSLKLWRLGFEGIRGRILRRSSRKRLTAGGAMIALVGSDGAGKSTALQGVSSWLSKYFVTTCVHMGKPPQSLGMYAIRASSLLSGWLGRMLNRDWSVQSGADAGASALPRYLWLLRRAWLARDRYRAYVGARRFATNGGLVICDRYPVPEITSMDGPQIGRVIDVGKTNRLVALLIGLEERYYQQIMPPEVLIVLRVDPEVAVRRRIDQDAAVVRARSQEIWTIDWRQTRAHVVDTCRSKADVLAEIKSLIWAEL